MSSSSQPGPSRGSQISDIDAIIQFAPLQTDFDPNGPTVLMTYDSDPSSASDSIILYTAAFATHSEVFHDALNRFLAAHPNSNSYPSHPSPSSSPHYPDPSPLSANPTLPARSLHVDWHELFWPDESSSTDDDLRETRWDTLVVFTSWIVTGRVVLEDHTPLDIQDLTFSPFGCGPFIEAVEGYVGGG